MSFCWNIMRKIDHHNTIDGFDEEVETIMTKKIVTLGGEGKTKKMDL